jgi:hypothetical protein
MVEVSEEAKQSVSNRRDMYKAIAKEKAQARKDQSKGKKSR